MKVLKRFRKKCFSKRKIIVGFLVCCMFFNTPLSVVLAGPEGAQVVNGQVSFQQSGYNTTITASDKSIINYNSFDIARPEIVEFIQPGSSASVLNRILSANPTNINGTLLANGRVFFVNPAGVYIGGGARVNVNQLVASGLNITNSDFVNGNYNFTGGNGSVINSGDITAEKVYLIGRQVANSGSINCPAGYVVMASGDRVFLGEPGSDVVLEVEAPSLPESADPIEGSGVLNEGNINAAGGKIVLAAAGDIYSQAISNVGSLSVSAETGDAGQAELIAADGQITNAGTIEASGDNGGSVTIDGGELTLTTDSVVRADAVGSGDGGTIRICADTFDISGVTSASSTQGAAGYVILDPYEVTIDTALAQAIVNTLGPLNTNYIVEAEDAIHVEALVDSSTQTTSTTLSLNENDTPSDDGLIINLNNLITLGVNQTLNGEGTEINVAASGSIQNGIDVTATDATVNVSTGTYTEDLTISTDGLELRSTSGNPDDVTIKGVANVDSTLWPLAAPNIEILGDDVSVHGFTIEGPDPVAGKYASGMVIGGLNVEVYDNKFFVPNASSWDDVSQGIQTYHGSVNPAGTDLSGLNIHDNEFSSLGPGTAGYEAIYINPVATDPTPGAATIADNTFGGALLRGITTERSNVTISGNNLSTTLAPADTLEGILVRSYAAANQQDMAVTGNTVDGFLRGIRIGTTGQTLTNIAVQENTITGNTVGVQVRDSADGVIINNNAISGNTTYGVENMDAGNTLDASANWYGTNDPTSVAAEVSANVDYTPWLDNGTDTDLVTPGFQGDFSHLHVDDDSPQTGSTGRIQEAIDLVTGSTVKVVAGSYTEDLNIDDSVTLEGAQAGSAIAGRTAGDSGESTITGSHTITGSTVTIDGFTLSDPDSGSGNVLVSLDSSGGAIDDVTLRNNFVTMGSGDVGVDLGGYSTANQAITNVSVEDSAFMGPGDQISNPMRIGGWFGSDYDVEVDSVTFQRNTVEKGSIPIQLQDEDLDNITITQNTFTNTDGTVYIWGNSGSTPGGILSNFEFSENSVDNTNSYGIGIDVFNVFDNSNFSGTTEVTNNSFDLDDVPTKYGIDSVSILSSGFTGTIDASGNWYGTNDASGVAAEVSANVDYTPWLDNGTDTDLVTPGFQGDFSHLHVDDDSPQTGSVGHIQEGIDLVSGSTVTVEPGTYNENMTINKANLTLQSASTTGTILTANSGNVIDIVSGGDHFTLGGTDGKGFTIDDSSGAARLVQITHGSTDVEISWNELDTTGSASMGINIGAAGATNLYINDNTFTAGTGDGAIWGGAPISELEVKNNEFTGPGIGVSSYAIELRGVAETTDSVITDNTVDGFNYGIAIFNGTSTTPTDGLDILRNDVKNNTKGIWLRQYLDDGTLQNVTVQANTLTGNTTGIEIQDADVDAGSISITNNFFVNNTTGIESQHDSASATIFENSFVGSTDKAVKNTGSLGALDASGNWWGSNTPAGVAGQVSTKVDYSPWLDIVTDQSSDPGFQGDFSTLYVSMASPQVGSDGRIQEAINLLTAGPTSKIEAVAGIYNDGTINVDRQFQGLYFDGTSQIDNTITLNEGLNIYTKNDGGITLNDIEDAGTHSLLVDTASLNTTNGQIDLDGSVEADGDITITGGIVNVGDSASDKVNSDGAVSIIGTGTVTVNAEIDPTTVGITSLNDASVAINNAVTADTQITITADDNVTFNSDGDLTTSSGSITVTADADGDDNGSGGAIALANGTVIDAGTGTIALAADGDIALGRLVTTNNTVTAISITSTSGAITDVGDNGGADIDTTGGADAQVTISAVTGIGASGAIETAARKIDASTVGAAAHIDIDNASVSATELTSVSTTGAGANITFDQTGGGDLTLTSVTTTDGTIDVSADSGNIIATLITAGTDGDILLDTTTSGNISLGSLTAADNQITINSAGAIYDSAADSVTDLTTSALVLDATGIGGGVGDEIETDAATLDATVGGTGDIDLKEKDAIELVDVDTSDGDIRIEAGGQMTATDVEAGGAGDVELTTTSGNVLVNDVKASGNQIKINSAGAIEESGSDSSADLTADTLSLTADDDIGILNAIETAANTIVTSTIDPTEIAADIVLNNDNSSATSLTASTVGIDSYVVFNQTGGGELTLTNISTDDGLISIVANSGNMVATQVNAGGDYDISLSTATSGDISIGSVTAIDNTIMINSAGAIGEVADTPEAVDLSAKALNLSAQTGITGSSPIETSATDIKAGTDAGDIDINNDNASLTTASLEVTTGAGKILFSQTGGGNLDIEAQTADGDIGIDVANANLKAGNITAGSTGNVTLEALQGNMSGGPITANGGTLIMRQQDSLNLKDFTFGNQALTDLTAQSDNGSFIADNTVAANAADKWQSITATADSGITLTGIGSITANTLTSTNGNIGIKSGTAVALNGPVTTQNGGGVTVTAQSDVTTQQPITTEALSVTTNSNIEIHSNSGDLNINDNLTANGGGVSLIAKDGKVYTTGDVLNVAITGSSDDAAGTGVKLPFGSSQKAAIVIISNEDLNLGTGAVLTANGKYYPPTTDERPNVNFKLDGEEIDAAIYLASADLSTGMGKNVDVGSAAITIDNSSGVGTLVVDAFDTVTFKNTFEDSLRSGGASDIKRLEAVSRISPDLNYARLNHTLPYADNPTMLAGGEFALSGGVYVLRGTSAGSLFSLAKVLDLTGPVPLVVPMPLEPEIEGEIEGPDLDAIMQLLDDLGIGVQPFLAQAYRPSLNTDLNLYKAAEKLLRLGSTLEDADGARIAALIPLIRGLSETPVPVEEQMTSFVQELARQELAGQWINALTQYVAILNNEIGLPADDSVARVMVRYGGKLTGPAESLFVEEYLAQSFTD